MKKILSKTILLLAFLGLSFHSVQAQYVTIPDANFANWLDTHYPFMNGNQMDTVWANVYNGSNMNIPNLGISNLFGVQYITNLNSLNVNYNLLTTLPPLPPNLTYLHCKGNPISVLPTLPNSITNLSCGSLQLTQISNLPSNLTTFYCEYASLSSLPQLPASITSFTLNFGSISTLPSFPNSLLVLDLSYESITTLPNPLPTSLQHLIFPNNSVTTLPPLPNSLIVLSAAYNQITCFPTLPNTINNMVIVGNPFTCLPNHIPAMDAATLAMPLCQTNDVINNPNNCPAATLNCNTCVIIPDPNFVNWLNINYPSCMNGNLMDTACADIINETQIYLNGLSIADLSGIQYFDSLWYLDCDNNQLSSLPVLPSLLQSLNCSYNLITSINNLPPSLNFLNCSFNLLTDLQNIPSTMKSLGFDYNQISIMPALPNSLTTLGCAGNQLLNLGSMPDSLTYLNCSANFISALPNLPFSLKFLGCAANQLTNLPFLPDSLLTLICTNNQLTSLPTLPLGLTKLFCDSNNLNCLPQLPINLMTPYDIRINFNPFDCLPNYVSGMDSATLSIPLCDANNINGCPSASGILGKVYNDSNVDCALDITDLLIHNIKVNCFNPLTSQFGITYTALNGVFNYPASIGTYFVLVDTLNKPYQANCLNPGIDSTVITTVSNPLASNVNFDIKCKPGLDLNVQSVNHKDGLIFPGQQHTLQVMVGDASQWYGLNCAAGASGQVQITVTGPVTYSGVAMGALTPTINGNVYTYTIADFGNINNAGDFQLLFTVDTTAQSGNQICVHVEVTPIVGDINPSNNIKDFCYSVVNSYDPNYKEVYPSNVPPLFQDWLTYTIHFQNLGNAPAFNIRILDTLDSNLDFQTFEVLNYSHFNTTTLQNGIVTFRFPNIMLPDSASNPSGSQGFVQYRIKPLANLPVGTQIENTAHIYFDFNPAIVTNTTVNNFVTTIGNTSLKHPSNLKVYPNPSTGVFMISATANIEVYNLIGDLVLTENNATSIDLTSAPKGMYFVKLNGGKIEKLIKN